MATNKNAQLRYQVLDGCLRNPGKRYFIDDLIATCNEKLYEHNGPGSTVSRRTIFEDLNFLESEAGWSAPIGRHKEGKRTYYRYDDLDFSISNQPLNETDINNLQSAIQILNKLQGIPQLQVLQQLLGKLTVGSTVADFNPIVSFDQNQYLKGMEFFPDLFNAITYEKVLKLTYQDFRVNEPYDVVFHPYHLKQYNNRWFVFGLDPKQADHPSNRALDRIVSVAELPELTYIPNTIDWSEYFEDFIGVTKMVEHKLVKVRLWVSSFSARYIETKPLHGSQKKISSDSKGVTLELELIPNYEFYQRLLSYGDAIQVISPEEVVNAVSSTLMKALYHYKQKE